MNININQQFQGNINTQVNKNNEYTISGSKSSPTNKNYRTISEFATNQKTAKLNKLLKVFRM